MSLYQPFNVENDIDENGKVIAVKHRAPSTITEDAQRVKALDATWLRHNAKNTTITALTDVEKRERTIRHNRSMAHSRAMAQERNRDKIIVHSTEAHTVQSAVLPIVDTSARVSDFLAKFNKLTKKEN